LGLLLLAPDFETWISNHFSQFICENKLPEPSARKPATDAPQTEGPNIAHQNTRGLRNPSLLAPAPAGMEAAFLHLKINRDEGALLQALTICIPRLLPFSTEG
jgi:hypothetical protein